jgi:magnesium transporter
MRLSQLVAPDLLALLENDPAEVRAALEEVHAEDLAEIISDLPTDKAVAILRALPDERTGEVMERLTRESQVQILGSVGRDDAVSLLSEMSPDDRVDLVQDIPDELANQLLTQLEQAEPAAAEELRELSAYGEDTAGGLMTPEYVGLDPQTKVWAAIEEVRRLSRENQAETIYSIYVVGYGTKLLGVVSLRDLILADPSKSLEDVMTENVVRVTPQDDQEAVASVFAKYDLNAVPVVDERGVMLGVVTVDDVVDVVIEEATEDAQMMAAVVPLEDSYFETSFATLVRKRAMWLSVLFVGTLLTANVLEAHESTLATVLALVFFIPVIVASGGNAGAQSSSLIIRGLAVGEVTPRDWFRVAGRELAMGLALGTMLGLLGFARAFFVDTGVSTMDIAVTVASSTIAVVTVGCLAGSLLPLAMQRLGLDPAVSSTPFITCLVDVVGLLVYFAVAKFFLGL